MEGGIWLELDGKRGAEEAQRPRDEREAAAVGSCRGLRLEITFFMWMLRDDVKLFPAPLRIEMDS